MSTHVLDVARGAPASGIAVRLSRRGVEGWIALGEGVTDDDGRVGALASGDALEEGEYLLEFETADYHASRDVEDFFPRVQVTFRIAGPRPHYHVPLLLSPFGYTTYRGS